MKIHLLMKICIFTFIFQSSIADTITLNDYLDLIQKHHPFFKKELLKFEIEKKRQERYLGDQDWAVLLMPSYIYEDTIATTFGSPNEIENTHFNISVERKIWKTGGRISLSYDYDLFDQEVTRSMLTFPTGDIIDIGGPAKFFQNIFSLTYIQPLLRNRGGGLDRSPYDLQGYTADQTNLIVLENQERFLREIGELFLDWVLFNEELRIANDRLDLAEAEFDQTKRKLDSNLIEKVDLFRTQDAVLVAQQNVKLVESKWRATQIELAVQANSHEIVRLTPEYDLFQLQPLPFPDSAFLSLKENSRLLNSLKIRLDQIDRKTEELTDVRRPELNLILSGGLKDGDESFGGATNFDKPNVGVALVFQYPWGNRTAVADIERIKLESDQVAAELENVSRELEAAIYNILTQIKELEPVLALNVEQIKTVANKTVEELRLYEQGRNQLTFVIQSRDDEAKAQLTYAINAARYQKLTLRYRALMDELMDVSE